MADISIIKLPNGSSYNVKDSSAISSLSASNNVLSYTKRNGTTGTVTIGESSAAASSSGVELTIPVSSWSSSQTTVNGGAYYTYSTTISELGNPHPTVFCSSATGILPSDLELACFDQINWITVDTTTNKITFYAKTKPGAAVVLIVQNYKAAAASGSEQTVTITTSQWSSSTTAINGSSYYSVKKTVSSLSSSHPTIMCGTADTLPSTTQKNAYDCIKWATVDTSTKTVTFYATTKPTSSAVLIIL